MLFYLRCTVHDVKPFSELREELGDFFGRVLEIIVQCDNNLVICCSDATEQRVVLTEIAGETVAADTCVGAGELLDDAPRAVPSAVLD